jgi:hypothetical protein
LGREHENRSRPVKSRLSFSRGCRSSPEIFGDNVHVERGGGLPVQVGIDNPPADLDRGMVAEIVGGFKNDPGRIQRVLRLRFIGTDAGALGMPKEVAFMADISPSVSNRSSHYMASAGWRFVPVSASPSCLRD